SWAEPSCETNGSTVRAEGRSEGDGASPTFQNGLIERDEHDAEREHPHAYAECRSPSGTMIASFDLPVSLTVEARSLATGQQNTARHDGTRPPDQGDDTRDAEGADARAGGRGVVRPFVRDRRTRIRLGHFARLRTRR